MLKFKFVKKEKIANLPATTGVYSFNKGAEFLYIGKAVDIKERVRNHFQQPTLKDNVFIPETENIGFIATNSEIEALILEAELIKKFQPKYNTQWKDGKNYYFVAITNEKFPRVFITHQQQKSEARSTKSEINTNFQKPKATLRGVRLLASSKTVLNFENLNFEFVSDLKFRISNFNYIGPFVDGKTLKQTLRVLRRIFPYRTCRNLPKKPCLYYNLKLCTAPCKINLKSQISKLKTKTQILKLKKEYNKNIKNLIKVLRGQKTQVLKNLQKEMKLASQKQDFEQARVLRDQTFALENILAHSHIFKQSETYNPLGVVSSSWTKIEKGLQKLLGIKIKITRIEGYDVSNIQGQEATGGLVVFKNGLPDKNEYRKFKIKISGKPNDTAMLQEMISRRLKHKEWPLPQIILIDGGIAQLNVAIATLKSEIRNSKSETSTNLQNSKFKTIKILSLAKRKNELYIEGRIKPILLKKLAQETANLILHIRDEAHRFAITYHKKLRSKGLLS